MIRSFKHKQLRALWETGQSNIDSRMHGRIMRRLDALNAAVNPRGLSLPGFNFHKLQGANPPRYTMHVNGPWCITFEFRGEDAYEVDFQQYH